MAAVAEAIPLTVIGGFLGTGKTTLVNHLLRSAERRWGVVVNDFGAVNVDAALIAARDGDTVALANGCVCCEMGDDLGAALARLAARRPAPEHVLVEASGVGDPWGIAQVALIEPGFALEPLVVLADATALAGQLDDRWVGDTVRRQLDHAELLLLTKADLADDAARAAVVALLGRLRPGVPVVPVTNGVVAAEALSFPVGPRPRASRLRAEAGEHPFRTWHWRPERPLERGALREALGALPASVLRVKGIVRLAPDGGTTALQYAARRWSFTTMPGADETGLVAIGTTALPTAEELHARFAAALAPGA